ncbi:MAG: LamG domain-containing protein, partial [bacterium]|nr:LamG domain-containing protein [bacterium]
AASIHHSIGSDAVGLWYLNGSAEDFSGYGVHGTVNGAALATDRNGSLNSAYSFDGVNDWVSFDDDILISGAGSRTITAWFLTNDGSTGTSGFSVIAGHGVSSPENRFDAGIQNNKLAVGYHSSYTNGTLNVEEGKWHHVAAVYDGTTTYLYLDGILDVSGPKTINTPTSPPSIGDRSNGQHFFYGIIDDVRMYSRALSASEVGRLYAGGAPHYQLTLGK